MTKVAVLSDVHGNVTALAATIVDANAQGADEFWFLGDLFMPGPGAHDVVEMLRELNVTVWLRGNWDDFMFAALERTVDYNKPTRVYTARLSAYVMQHMPKADYDFIMALPVSDTRNVEDLTFTLSHNMPNKNAGHELLPMSDQYYFDALFLGRDADVAIYGHTHQMIYRTASDGRAILNPGSVGSPFSLKRKMRQNREARYLMLDIEGTRFATDFRTVAYDQAAEMALAEERGLPYLDLYRNLVYEGLGYVHDASTVAKENDRYGYDAETKDMLRELRQAYK